MEGGVYPPPPAALASFSPSDSAAMVAFIDKAQLRYLSPATAHTREEEIIIEKDTYIEKGANLVFFLSCAPLFVFLCQR